MFTHAVPPIPRKLIRAAELLDFLSDLPRHLQPDKLLLARLVLLQLFAPAVFRHLRRVNPQLIRVLADWHKDGKLIASELEKLGKKEPSSELDKWLVEEKPLIEKMITAGQNRVNFDPCKVFANLDSIASDLELTEYFHLVGEKETVVAVSAESMETAYLSDQNEFLVDLFSDREASWRKALDLEELQGKVLADDTFKEIITKLQQDKNRQGNLEWLEALLRRLSRIHTDTLDGQFQLRDKLIARMKDESLAYCEAIPGR